MLIQSRSVGRKYNFAPPPYSCESPYCPFTHDPRPYSIHFFGSTKKPAEISAPWSKVDASGSGPSATKSLSQRMKYCALTAIPFHLMPASVAHIRYVALSTVTPGANAPVEKVSTPSELYSDVLSGLVWSRLENRSSRDLVNAVPNRMRTFLEAK